MLESRRPVSLILLSVAIEHLPKSIPKSIPVSSFVVIAIGPSILSFTILFIMLPLSRIIFSTVCSHCSEPAHLIILEVSFEDAAIEHEHPFPVPLIVQKITIIPTPIWIASFSLPSEGVVPPLPRTGKP